MTENLRKWYKIRTPRISSQIRIAFWIILERERRETGKRERRWQRKRDKRGRDTEEQSRQEKENKVQEISEVI